MDLWQRSAALGRPGAAAVAARGRQLHGMDTTLGAISLYDHDFEQKAMRSVFLLLLILLLLLAMLFLLVLHAITSTLTDVITNPLVLVIIAFIIVITYYCCYSSH